MLVRDLMDKGLQNCPKTNETDEKDDRIATILFYAVCTFWILAFVAIGISTYLDK